MAQFILGNSVKDQLNKRPLLRNAIWRTEAFVLGGLLHILSWFPIETTSRFGQKLGRFMGPRLHKHKSIIKNLKLAFPEMSAPEIDLLASDIWASAGAVLTEFACVEELARGNRIKIAVAGYIEAFNRSDKPCIIVSAHLSNWEVIGAAATRMIQPIYAPYTPPSNPWLDRKLIDYRKPLGVELLARDESIRPMVQCLSKGHSLALLMDQRVDSGSPVPFFGKDKLTTLVPARLGLRFNCEIVPVRVERLERSNFRVTFYPPVGPDEQLTDDFEKAENVTAKINQLFESWISEKPQEWFCSNRMWAKELESELN